MATPLPSPRGRHHGVGSREGVSWGLLVGIVCGLAQPAVAQDFVAFPTGRPYAIDAHPGRARGLTPPGAYPGPSLTRYFVNEFPWTCKTYIAPAYSPCGYRSILLRPWFNGPTYPGYYGDHVDWRTLWQHGP